jgi:excisionase family DNA binding protein
MRIAYSILEAAEATSLGRSTIEEAVAKGRLPARKFGARTLILAVGLDRLSACFEDQVCGDEN